MMGWLFRRPWLVQGTATLLAVVYLVWSFAGIDEHAHPNSTHGSRLPVTVSSAAEATSLRDTSLERPAAEPLNVISAYNAASIVAGQTGNSTLLHPFLTATGAAREAADAEFDRRSRRLERHVPELVRWGVVTSEIDDMAATIQTQEVWHDETLLAGTVISADRNLIARHTYHLVRQHATQPWLIDRVETHPVVQ